MCVCKNVFEENPPLIRDDIFIIDSDRQRKQSTNTGRPLLHVTNNAISLELRLSEKDKTELEAVYM